MAAFFLDHNVHQNLVGFLQSKGHQAQSVRAQKLIEATDDELLLFAAQRNWTFVTYNAADFILLHDAWCRWSKAWNLAIAHAGILILEQISEHTTGDALMELLDIDPSFSNQLYTWRQAHGWRVRITPYCVPREGSPIT